jgi:hypothetical protein
MMVDIFIGVLAAIACWYGLVWAVGALLRTLDKAGAIIGKEAGEAFVRDAKENPKNPMYGVFHLPPPRNDDPSEGKVE